MFSQEFPFVCTHTVCGQIAFFMREPLVPAGFFRSCNVRMPDGSTPEAESPIVCGGCGQPIESPLDHLEVTRLQ